MIIDFHTHIFPNAIAGKTISALEDKSGINAATDGTIDGLLLSMEKTGVDLSIILPVVTKPSQFESINTFAKSINEKYEGKLFSFGGIHPDSENYKEELKKIKEFGLKGVKIHPDYQRVMIDDIRYMRIIEYAGEIGLIVITHAGIDIGLPNPIHCPPDKVRKVLDKIRPEKMVLAHYGGWKQWEDVYNYLAGENVYFDTAFTFDYIESEMFLKILNKHDKNKILFATDSPWSHADRDINKLKEIIEGSGLNEENVKVLEENILYKNAAKILNI